MYPLTEMSTYLAGGSLTALNKVKPGCPPDIRPIAVGETLRRLTGKCLCAVIKDKASELFHPLQFGVACTACRIREDHPWPEEVH